VSILQVRLADTMVGLGEWGGMMARPMTRVLIALLAVLGVACSTVRTTTDFDPDTNFGAWQTYAWFPAGPSPTGDPRLDNPLLHDRVEAAVSRTLDAAGFIRVQGDSPDFYVNYHLSTEQRINVHTIDRHYMGGPHNRHWGGRGWSGVGWTETRIEEFEEGSLIIDFVDVSARRLVWRGTGTRRLSRNTRSDRVTQSVNAAVEEILAQFPPD
jgi:hypothetical protein